MDYVCPIDELEQRLKDAGQELAFPPSSTNEILDILDKIEQLLTFVGQKPSMAMQAALMPSMGALIANRLVKHSDIDVRVSVASCLCEIVRITAPDPPYCDGLMKDIFELIVLAFGHLSNDPGQSYHKAIHILESIAVVKSCLIMLDLECDALVLEMFERFFNEIRVTHPDEVFSDMETVMTLIIKESDEISNELLTLLISHVKKENQNVTPASWKLAEKVLTNCNDVLKPYSETITKLVNSNLGDYADVVTVLCTYANENGHMVTRSTRAAGTHKRDLNTMENGESVKKQKHIDNNQLKEKEPETSRRGRPKKNKISLNQDNHPNLVQNSQEEMRRTRFQDKKQSSETKGNIENSGSLHNVVVKNEDETLSDYEGLEPFTLQKNTYIQKRKKTASNKRVGNSSCAKDIPKKWGQDLVGHRIKVWWPLDKRYYKGAVSSYNPLDDKHKVLYADGDEEVLNLHDETWMMLNEISPDQVRVADLQSPMTRHSTRRKQNEKRRLESSLKQKDNSNSPKSPPPADSSKTADVVISIADDQNNNPVPTAGISRGIKLTKNATDDMEKDGDLKPNGELQVKKQSHTS